MMNYNHITNGIQVSEVGLGCEHFVGLEYSQIKSIIDIALEGHINFLDVFMAQPTVRRHIGKALGKRRKQVILQGHIGAVMCNNQPSVSRDINEAKQHFEDFMTLMNTDYVDIGYLHFIDNIKELDDVIEGEIMAYASQLKNKGTIRAIGLSTHNVDVAIKAVDNNWIDCLMFPVNPAFDLMPKKQNIFDIFVKEQHHTEKWFEMQKERQRLYDLCKTRGVKVVAMKPLGGGMLLNKDFSPFQVELSVHQCVNYCLNIPIVASAMVGCRTEDEIHHLIKYPLTSDRKKAFAPRLAQSNLSKEIKNCMYCNHCLPCPQEIDIATVMKYYDIARVNGQDNYIKNHYNRLDKKAIDCIECNQCSERCPFGIEVVDYMRKITDFFGDDSK